MEPRIEGESEEHCRKSWRCSRGPRIMFLANNLSINSSNIRGTHIGSQMDVRMGAGRWCRDSMFISLWWGQTGSRELSYTVMIASSEGSRGAEGAQRGGFLHLEGIVL